MYYKVYYIEVYDNLIIPNSNCLFRFSYLLEGNLQQYFTSNVSSICRLHIQ